MCGGWKREWNVATRYASGSFPSNEVIHSGFAMTTFFGTLSRAIAAIALVSSLGACALSPGMTFDAKHLVDPLDPNSVAQIKEITPSLVLDDNRARQALLDNASAPGTSSRSWSGITPSSCFRRKPTPLALG
jgi:hypothetical protein